MNVGTPVHKWADMLEACIAESGVAIVDRVAVFAETLSTQDTARRMASGKPGVLVVTSHQSQGRGRLGRSWLDHPDHSLAMSIATDAHRFTPAFLSLAVGVALVRACGSMLPEDTLGLKWPNDLVERKSGRKLAGILIEGSGGLAVVGIGVNVTHSEAQLRSAGLSSAASLVELGASTERIAVAQRVLVEIDQAVRQGESELMRTWRERDTLTGTHGSFLHDGSRYDGVIEAIEPTLTLVVRTRTGIHRLPALSTSLVAPEL
ncbi:MAG: biotin--[acetyl-CoA-carboxylase] ligase [Planctomycetota bacterium]